MYDIIVCGSNTVDTFVQTDAEVLTISGRAHEREVEERLLAYPLGSKIYIKHAEDHIGGGGTNALATFVEQGLNCAYIGKVGEDTNGHKVYEWLKEKKIDFLGQVGDKTGFSIVLDSQANDRSILNYRGANNSLEFESIPREKLRADWFYASGMQGESYETLKKLFKLMRNSGIKTVFNTNCGAVEEGIDRLKEALEHLTVFIVNKEEAQFLVEAQNPKTLAEKLAEFGPQIVVVTDGENGATMHVTEKYDGKQQTVHISPSHHLLVVETTGAGDAFCSGFTAGLAAEKDLDDCLRMGVINAEAIIQKKGTKENLPDKKEMAKLLKKSHHDIRVL